MSDSSIISSSSSFASTSSAVLETTSSGSVLSLSSALSPSSSVSSTSPESTPVLPQGTTSSTTFTETLTSTIAFSDSLLSSSPATLSTSSLRPSTSSLISSSPGISSSSYVTVYSVTPIATPSSSASYEPCPTQAQDICGSDTQGSTTCSSTNGTAYNVNCGITYTGTEVDESDVVYPPSNSSSSSSSASSSAAPTVGKRSIQTPEWTFDYCQETCNWTPDCVAINFINEGCKLLKNITGYHEVPNAVRAKPVLPVYRPPEQSSFIIENASPAASTCSRRIRTGAYTVSTTRQE